MASAGVGNKPVLVVGATTEDEADVLTAAAAAAAIVGAAADVVVDEVGRNFPALAISTCRKSASVKLTPEDDGKGFGCGGGSELDLSPF